MAQLTLAIDAAPTTDRIPDASRAVPVRLPALISVAPSPSIAARKRINRIADAAIDALRIGEVPLPMSDLDLPPDP